MGFDISVFLELYNISQGVVCEDYMNESRKSVLKIGLVRVKYCHDSQVC